MQLRQETLTQVDTTSVLQNYALCSTCIPRPSETGQIKDCSHSSRRPEEIICTSMELCQPFLEETPSPFIQVQRQKKRKLSTQESPLQSKPVTFNAKRNCSAKSTQTTSSSSTSAPGSIGKEKAFDDSWTRSSRAKSARLSLPVEIDYVASDSNYWSLFSSDLKQNSWFSAPSSKPLTLMAGTTSRPNWLRTCLQSLPSLSQKPMVCAPLPKRAKGKLMVKKSTKADVQAKSKKLKPSFPMKVKHYSLRPNATEKLQLHHWINAFRWTYNQCVKESLALDLIVPKVTEKYRKQLLRQNCVGKKNGKVLLLYQDVPESIRDEAFRDFFKARKTAFVNLKNGTIKHFNIKIKKRLPFNAGSLGIRSRFYNGGDKVSAILRNTYQGSWLRKIKSNPLLPLNLPKDSRLTLNKKNQWTLHVPVPICDQGVDASINSLGEYTSPLNYPEKLKTTAPSIVAVDPGGRTFMTAYVASIDQDLHGMVQEFGTKKDANFLLTIEKQAAKLTNAVKSKQTNQRKRRGCKRRARRLRHKVRDCVDELHRKTAIWLLGNHSAVVIPSLKTKSILMKKTLNKAAKTTLKRWGHYRFQHWMKHKAASFPNCTLIDWGDEAYTTQACGACGNLNKNVGSSKIYRCSDGNCGYSLRRDVHGARNILVKFMAECGEYLPAL